MGQRYSTVIIFRSGQWPVEHVASVLIPTLQPGVAEPRYDLEVSPDGREAQVPDASTIDGTWRWRDDPARGHAVAIFAPSANAVVRGDYDGLRMVDNYLTTALSRLEPELGYFSIFEDHRAREWIEKVMTQLRARPRTNLKVDYERVLLSAALRAELPWRPEWTVIAETHAGVLVKTRAFD